MEISQSRRRLMLPTVVLLAVLTGLGLQGQLTADEQSVREVLPDVDFGMHIRPLLQAYCIDCHGPDLQESRFRLDRRSGLLRGGDSGEPAVIPGNSQASHLIQLVSAQEPGTAMPPDPGSRLTEQQIELLSRWIDQGAAWDAEDNESEDAEPGSDHWSFQPILSPTAPAGTATGSDHPIDRFIRHRLEAAGLEPNQEADRRQLIRRIRLDMLGLPPTPEHVRRFTVDPRPDAWEQLVDECLASPHYGERWGQYWLDLVRFAETHGFETNRERPNAWPYRDYVIDSLNIDRPYDQFLREQLAGDQLDAPVATGFLVAGPYDLVKSPDVSLTLMQRHNELDDMINTTGTVFLGLTLGCARCHNHKFDPVRQTDYYALQAIFSGVQHGDRTVPLTPQQQAERNALVREVQQLREPLLPFLSDPASGGRSPVNATFNEEVFNPVAARRIRMTIRATNASEPCLDEFEVFAGGRNVATAEAGSVATSSGSLPGYEIHKLEHVNDGRYGNSRSWIANASTGWLQIEFPSEFVIDRVVWSRDREGNFSDRVATDYVIEVSTDPEHWIAVASSADRRPVSGKQEQEQEPSYDFNAAPAAQAAQGRQWHTRLLEVRRQLEAMPPAITIYTGQFQQPQRTRRLFRGDPLSPREEIAPGTVRILGDLGLSVESAEAQRRMALAEWIVSPDNPLTARVIVNRLWQYHFGNGLVMTPSDFGVAGMLPTHPELLDWLARQLLDHEWSLKHIHRLILTSATYRQSSRPRASAMAIDGASSLWWRFPPRRLEAEPIRDSVLAVSGALDLRRDGSGFSAFEVSMENVRHYFPRQSYGPEDWRRMIYMTRVRQEQDSVFGIFDCPDGATSVPVRSRSTTPLQALNLFNSSFMLQQSSLFALRLERECGRDTRQQVSRAYELCFSRTPADDELAEAVAMIRQFGLPEFCRALLNSNEFLFIP